IGTDAWNRLPEAVHERFADTCDAVTYAGAFEIVRASALGRVFAWLGTLVGTPVAPRAEDNVEARVRVRPDGDGVAWDREYRWSDGTHHVVRSTKVVADGKLIEKLPARLCMPLDTYEDGGVLHFVSKGYYFDLGLGDFGRGLKLWLPGVLSPGVTHVEHVDLGHGWFRFTMTVMHPLFGEIFFQTGRFSATEELP
ncbi:MAG TPA: DUF4166 domain-containing protein, partial [Steroidobacteraceae bacterium]